MSKDAKTHGYFSKPKGVTQFGKHWSGPCRGTGLTTALNYRQAGIFLRGGAHHLYCIDRIFFKRQYIVIIVVLTKIVNQFSDEKL